MTAEFHYALDAMRAGRNVLISGKPGSGKSTLLNLYLEQLNRATDVGADSVTSVMVTAPTGEAARNVHGYTIHKVFGFRPYTSVEDVQPGGAWRPARSVQETLAAIDVLVIDEISMVRADHFDMMDRALRMVRENKQPFGGVQLVLVGDLLQLPPVVRDNEREDFLKHWDTPYFFSSEVYARMQLEWITLNKVWRHSDATFVEILNQIREGSAGPRVLAALNTLVLRDEDDTDQWVTLSSYRRTVNRINNRHLNSLAGPVLTSRAAYEGSASAESFGGVDELRYGRGMRVMMLIDDTQGRFQDGSFGTVTHATDAVISVQLDHSGQTVEIQRHRWNVTRPIMRDGRLASETVGSVTQFPVVAAWAMTIHKAQGKTIPRCVIDLHDHMGANGQLYVALSRAVDMEHLRFSSPVTPKHLQASNAVMRRVRRDLSPRVNPERLVFIAFDGVSLGIREHIARMHVVIANKGKIVADFGSWINPNCDLGEFGARMKVPPRGLALAPDLSDFWPLLLRQAAGGLVVGDRLAVLERAIRHQERGLAINLGVGYDCADFGITLENASLRERCLEMYERYKRGDMDIERGLLVPPANPHTEGAVYQPVWAEQQPMKLDHNHATDSDNAWASCFGGSIRAKDPNEVVETAELLSAWAISRGVWDHALRREVLDRTRPNTRAKIELPEVDPRTIDLDTLFTPGTRVAFSGCGYSSEDKRTDSDFDKLCKARELEFRLGVSRKKCDVLIARDPSSTSRKAKRAREFGIPIIELAAFDRWCDNTATKTPGGENETPAEVHQGLGAPMRVETMSKPSALTQPLDGDWDFGSESNWDKQWDEAWEAELSNEKEPGNDEHSFARDNAAEAPSTAPAGKQILTPQQAAALLNEGARVAFRGSTYVHGELRPHGPVLDELCRSLGLEYKQAVSKTRCDALVTDDTETKDGKNSLALRYGTPLILARDFTAWAESKLDDKPELIENVKDLDDEAFLDALARGELVQAWDDSAPEFTYATAAWDFAPAWQALSETEDTPVDDTTHTQGAHFRTSPDEQWRSDNTHSEEATKKDRIAFRSAPGDSVSQGVISDATPQRFSLPSDGDANSSAHSEKANDTQDGEDSTSGSHASTDNPEGKEPFAAMIARLQAEKNTSDTTPRSRARRAVSEEEHDTEQPAQPLAGDDQWGTSSFAEQLRKRSDASVSEDDDDEEPDWDEWEDTADAEEDVDWDEDDEDDEEAVLERPKDEEENLDEEQDDKHLAEAFAVAFPEEKEFKEHQRAAELNETTLERRRRKHKSALKRVFKTALTAVFVYGIGVVAVKKEWDGFFTLIALLWAATMLLLILFTLHWFIRLCALGAAKLGEDDSAEEAASERKEGDGA
ncbi:ATP-dependent RecD-like DNA helicase [Corynebacterium ciconiae DSM 44920]|nr:ATP-dependent RecD-like DNA helicase [Corynebacterium ciconiae DSM 44920]